MKLYIKIKDNYQEIVSTRQLAKIAGVSKQAVQKNKHLKPYLFDGNKAFYLRSEIEDFITYEKSKNKYKRKGGNKNV